MKKINVGLMLAMLAVFCIALIAIIFVAGCGGGDDDDDCATTETCSGGPDAGTMTTDADPTAPDADTTPDATMDDPCADYADVPRTGWLCDSGSIPFSTEINPVVQGGVCVIHSPDFWCQDTPSASAVMAGYFTCTAVDSQANIRCTH